MDVAKWVWYCGRGMRWAGLVYGYEGVAKMWVWLNVGGAKIGWGIGWIAKWVWLCGWGMMWAWLVGDYEGMASWWAGLWDCGCGQMWAGLRVALGVGLVVL